MWHVIVGFVGLALAVLPYNVVKNEPETFERPIPKAIYWAVTLLGLYLVYWGWIRG